MIAIDYQEDAACEMHYRKRTVRIFLRQKSDEIMMTPKDFIKEMLEFTDKRQALDWEIEKLVRKSGWKYSCDWPDCCWRWIKNFDGKVIQASTATEAMEVQTRIYQIQNPGAWPDQNGEY